MTVRAPQRDRAHNLRIVGTTRIDTESLGLDWQPLESRLAQPRRPVPVVCEVKLGSKSGMGSARSANVTARPNSTDLPANGRSKPNTLRGFGALLEKVKVLWCVNMHDSLSWPRSGYYRCLNCGRFYSVPWDGVSAFDAAQIQKPWDQLLPNPFPSNSSRNRPHRPPLLQLIRNLYFPRASH